MRKMYRNFPGVTAVPSDKMQLYKGMVVGVISAFVGKIKWHARPNCEQQLSALD